MTVRSLTDAALLVAVATVCCVLMARVPKGYVYQFDKQGPSVSSEAVFFGLLVAAGAPVGFDDLDSVTSAMGGAGAGLAFGVAHLLRRDRPPADL